MPPSHSSCTLPRRLAFQILRNLEKHSGFSNQLLSQAIQKHDLSALDKAWLTEVVYGTLRYQHRIDAFLGAYSNKPLEAMPRMALVALRLGIYQLLVMQIPAHGAVHQTVALLQPFGQRLKNLVNAILRTICRQDQQLLTCQWQNTTLSQQQHWLYDALKNRLTPENYQAWLASCEQQANLCIRLQKHLCSIAQLQQALQSQGIESQSHPMWPDSLCLKNPGNITQLPGFHEGWFVVQDAAATLVGSMVMPQEDAVVLDVCAAPGGKTCQIAASLSKGSRLIAIDCSVKRLQQLEENKQRLKLTNIELLLCDASDSAALQEQLQEIGIEKADWILVDAPCSGLGTLRRHPELLIQAEERLQRLLPLQAQLLRTVAQHLKPNGFLIYTVCSPLPQEGYLQVEHFLEEHHDFQRLTMPEHLTPWLNSEGDLQTWSHKDPCDSFYATFLQRIDIILP